MHIAPLTTVLLLLLPWYIQGTASLNVAVAGSIVMHRFSEWAADSCQGGAEEERHVNDEFSASSVSSPGM